MNIIALSLGLAPIPPLPPAVRERQNRIADDHHRCTNVGRMTRQSATAYRAGKKGDAAQDINKAQWYLRRMTEGTQA